MWVSICPLVLCNHHEKSLFSLVQNEHTESRATRDTVSGKSHPVQSSQDQQSHSSWIAGPWKLNHWYSMHWVILKCSCNVPTVNWLWLPSWHKGKESAASVRDVGSIPGSGRSPGVGNGNLLQYSCLKNAMDTGAWWVTKSWTYWVTQHGTARRI